MGEHPNAATSARIQKEKEQKEREKVRQEREKEREEREKERELAAKEKEKERKLAARKEREHELLLKKMELETEERRIDSTIGERLKSSFDVHHLIQRFHTKVGDVNLYLTLFERQVKRLKLPEELWVSHL
ncbi:hypothetical protein AVEN_1476-1 [Araneus ventricosus]|uniref:Eukaryotic translation initiation factor 3 subunit A n=1 Tax=Araneus ventricosus TaxID=182803 RepID=A0A4Y2M1A4_ARAVE|nr:hypothetical protein AVEN_1476-1 [Araneus ventricosus]